MNRWLAVLAALAVSASAGAQAYKWVDKDGKVRYGDTPPPGVKATPLKPPPRPSSPPPSPAAEKKDAGAKDKPLTPEQAFRKRQQEREEAEKKSGQERAEADKKRQNCESAQASLRQLESGQRIATVDAKGERVIMEDAQREQQLQRARSLVSEWCK